jgi:hypothetical protein
MALLVSNKAVKILARCMFDRYTVTRYHLIQNGEIEGWDISYN